VRGAQETDVAHLAAAFGLQPGELAGVMGVVLPELAWTFESRTLSRGGLADLVAALGPRASPAGGDAAAFAGAAARAEGERLLALFLGGETEIAALAHRAAALARADASRVRPMLPSLALLAVAGLAGRASGGLGTILKVIPPLGPAALGSPHADLAGILRRRCGVGPYAARRLRKLVRRELAAAGGFRPDGPASWYLRRMLIRPLLRLARWLNAPSAR
jgi:hypothetical protein